MSVAEEIKYDIRWSTDVDADFIRDFILVENQVFGPGYNTSFFRKKFEDNIYGPSLLAVVYIAGRPSAARALWRNDINGREAYQPGDTCVLKQCRGKGVFTAMTMKAIAQLPKEAIIYNFPNTNSYQGYMKMGWILSAEYPMVLFNHKDYDSIHPYDIDEEYAKWWLYGNSSLMHIKRGGNYYLIAKHSRPLCYRIVGRTSKEVALNFKRFRKFGVLFYLGNKLTFYNKRYARMHVVSRNADPNINIPTWKIDAV